MALTREQNIRYARQILLPGVGGGGQEYLLAARVAVVGAGGLGSPLLLYLAAAGVGHLTVIDDDSIALSNLQRQVLYETAQVGQGKADHAATRLTALNPDCQVTAKTCRITAHNAVDLLAEHTVVADCSDNFYTRFIINDVCVKLGLPLVSAAVQEFSGQLGTFDPRHGGPCYRCFCPALPPRDSATPPCEANGILGAVAGVLGTWQALSVIQVILGQPTTPAHIHLFDGRSGNVRKIRLHPDPACPTCGPLQRGYPR